MRKFSHFVKTTMLVVLLVILFSSSALDAAPPPPENPAAPFVPGEMLVGLKPNLVAVADIHSAVNANIMQVIGGRNPTHRVQLPANQTFAQAAAIYKRDPRVAFVEPNYLARIMLPPPNDPSYNDGTQWALQKIQAVEAWALYPNTFYDASTKPRDATKIAIVDTGVDYNHNEFINAGGSGSDVTQGGQIDRADAWNFVNGTNDPMDDQGHGTHVAGIAAASANNGTSYTINGVARGVIGVGYIAQVIPIKALDNNGSGTYANIANGIVRAADRGAVVINLSLGGTAYSQAMQNAVNYAWSRGSVVVVAAGNNGTGDLLYPASNNYAFAVAATDRNDVRASFSSFGRSVGVAAPGVGIFAPLPTTQTFYGTLSGTSMAAPHVAGLAALYAASRGFTQSTPNGNAQIVRALQQGADNIANTPNGGWSQEVGYGRINALRTLGGAALRPATVGSIVGQVRDANGSAVNGATVRAGNQTVTTGADGIYRMANLPASNYNVTVSSFGQSFFAQTVSVPAGADVNATFTSGVAPTNTPSPTQQPTLTATPTPLPTNTPTNTPPPTNTATPRNTPTPSPTPPPTLTATNTPTNIPTPPPTLRPTQTPTNTPTNSVWYFAEGNTQAGFVTFLLLSNPNASPVNATVTYYKDNGAATVKTYALRATSRTNIYVNNEVPNATLAMKVEASNTVIAERAMYVNKDGHVSHGIAAPSRTWYFAEGATAAPFQTRILLHNPNASAAQVSVSFMKEDGSSVVRVFTLAAFNRLSVNANQIVPNAAIATTVASDLPIVAERTMYFGTGVHGATGVTAPRASWYLAEGFTGNGFDTWILLSNPNFAATQASVSFFKEDGTVTTRTFTVNARSRLNIYANQIVPNVAFSTRVTASQPIVVERAMYFGPSNARGGHNSEAAAELARRWYLAEGSTQGAFNTYILLMNPNNVAANVTVRFLKEDGTTLTQTYSLAPTSRFTIWANQQLVNTAFSTDIAADQSIVVERAMYFNNFSGGTAALGVAR
jgi:thermitase